MNNNKKSCLIVWALMMLIQLYLVSAMRVCGQESDPALEPVEVSTALTLTLGDIEKMLFSSEVLQARARFYHTLARKADGNGNVVVTASEQAVLQRRYPGVSPSERRVNDLANAMRDRVNLQALADQFESMKRERDSLRSVLDADRLVQQAKSSRRTEVLSRIENYQNNTPTEPAAVAEFDALKAERGQLNTDLSELNTKILATRDAVTQLNADLVSLRERIQTLKNQ